MRQVRKNLVVLFITLTIVTQGSLAQKSVAIKDVTLISPHLDEPLNNATVLIENGNIVGVGNNAGVTIPPGVEVVDGKGKWLLPGIIEVHSHSIQPRDLRQALALGITTAQTIANSDASSQQMMESHHSTTLSPRLIFLDGYVGEFIQKLGGQSIWTVDTAQEARTVVEEMKNSGVNGIKIWQDDGSLWFNEDNRFSILSQPVLNALVDSAHKFDMRVGVHAWNLSSFSAAVSARSDALLHPVVDTLVPNRLWIKMREENVAWTTTLSGLLVSGNPREFAKRILADPRLVEVVSKPMRAWLETNAFSTSSVQASMPLLAENFSSYYNNLKQNTRNAIANDIEIVVGSDAPIGIGTHLEMELLAELGLSAQQIIAAATLNGAKALGLEKQLGTIEPAKLADLVLINSDPLKDIKNLRDVAIVFKGGQQHNQNELLSP